MKRSHLWDTHHEKLIFAIPVSVYSEGFDQQDGTTRILQ